jgi:glutamyl-tRNA synthetase
MDAAAVVGELAASLGLVPTGSRLSAGELLAELEPANLVAAIQTARMDINSGP